MLASNGGLRIVHVRVIAFLLVAALLVVSACGTPATSSAATATPIPGSASPRASAWPVASAPLPTDFVLPRGCAYVGTGTVDITISTLTTWEVNCGAAPDFDAIEKLSPAFAQQGWTLCRPPMGKGFWAKGAVQTIVTQSAVGYPTLSQLPRQAQDCPPPTAYVNGQYKFSLELPAPYRWTSRLSFADRGGKQPAQDSFTARTPEDEVTSGQRCGDTSCAIWNYVALVEIWPDEASTGAPREWYQRYSYSAGERFQDMIVDGRPAVRIDGGATYPVQYIIRDGTRLFRVAYLIYPPDFGPTPFGASRDKLEQILTSFRFIP
jgi:hypothetical protein